jgi:large subunit ribosomal protein L31
MGLQGQAARQRLPGIGSLDNLPIRTKKMKTDIHPEFYTSTVTCSCGNVFETGATKPTLRVEICSKCHPFYTGEQRIVDSQGRIERMRRRYNMK